MNSLKAASAKEIADDALRRFWIDHFCGVIPSTLMSNKRHTSLTSVRCRGKNPSTLIVQSIHPPCARDDSPDDRSMSSIVPSPLRRLINT